MQICYAIALGYLFVIIFYNSKSLVPCIISHILTNSLAIFNVKNDLSTYTIPIVLIIISVGYAIFINKTVDENSRDCP